MFDYSDLKTMIRRLGIVVKETEKPPEETAYCYFDKHDARYHISINSKCFVDSKVLLLHEFSHIIKGDLVVPGWVKNFRRYNIACDAINNYTLNFTAKQTNGYVLYDNIQYDDVFQVVSRQKIYNLLENMDFEQGINDIIAITPEEQEKAVKELKRIVTDLYLDDNEELKKLIKTEITRKSKEVRPLPLKKVNKLIENFERISYSIGAKKNIFARRIDNRNRNGLYIKAPKPMLSIIMFVDVSGSIEGAGLIDEFLGYAKDSKKWVVDIYYFASNAKKHLEEVDFSGTNIVPCLEILNANKHNYDASIMISDFEFFDMSRVTGKYRNMVLVADRENEELKEFSNKLNVSQKNVVILKRF